MSVAPERRRPLVKVLGELLVSVQASAAEALKVAGEDLASFLKLVPRKSP